MYHTVFVYHTCMHGYDCTYINKACMYVHSRTRTHARTHTHTHADGCNSDSFVHYMSWISFLPHKADCVWVGPWAINENQELLWCFLSCNFFSLPAAFLPNADIKQKSMLFPGAQISLFGYLCFGPGPILNAICFTFTYKRDRAGIMWPMPHLFCMGHAYRN